MKKYVAGAVTIAACYSILPTIIIRKYSHSIIKRTKEKGILLTFDDGPNLLYTEQLLALLEKHQLKAMFFIVAEKAQRYPELIQKMQQLGHVIGIHHYTHQSGALLTPFQLKQQLTKSQHVIRSLTKQQAHFYRPPWGHFNVTTLSVAKDLHIMTWSDIFGDWNSRTCQTTLLQQLHAGRKDGAIYVLHDCGQTLGADSDAPHYMLQALTQFLEEAIQDGQQFVDAQQWAKSYV